MKVGMGQRVSGGTRAVASFFGALLRHEDRIAEKSASGYPLLDGWKGSTEQVSADTLRGVRLHKPVPSRAALYCYEGPHQGETLLLQKEVETLGSEARNSIVVTPAEPSGAFFQFFLGRGLRCVAANGHSLRVNGNQEREADLFDFDRLDLLGNRFVVLDLATSVLPEVQR